VRPVETPETIGGGKILLTEKTRQDMTSHQMEVIALGLPSRCVHWAECERPHCTTATSYFPGGEPVEATHICDAKVGDWVLVAHRSLSETDTDGIFICSQDDVLAILHA